MKRKRKLPKRKKLHATLRPAPIEGDTLTVRAELDHLKKHVERLWEQAEKSEERLQDIEIHVNLLTRLLTTICVEKFGMRVGVLKRLIKRVEKEAIRDSQILHLESLYKLPHHTEKKSNSEPPSKQDPWEEIS